MAVSDPFWEAALHGGLRLQWSTVADVPVQYPRPVSPYSTSDRLEWRDVPTDGVVLASTVVHRHSHAEFAGQCPFGLALIALVGGARLMTRFDPSVHLAPGTAVVVGFRGNPLVPFATPVDAAPERDGGSSGSHVLADSGDERDHGAPSSRHRLDH